MREGCAEMMIPPEKAKTGHDGFGGGAKRTPGGDGEDDHDEQGDPVHLLASELVTEPTEEELSEKGTHKGDTVESRVHSSGQNAGLLGGGVVVVQTSQQFGDDGNAEQVVSVGEKSHTRNDNGSEMVPLRLGHIQRLQYWEGRHCGGLSPVTPQPPCVANNIPAHSTLHKEPRQPTLVGITLTSSLSVSYRRTS